MSRPIVELPKYTDAHPEDFKGRDLHIGAYVLGSEVVINSGQTSHKDDPNTWAPLLAIDIPFDESTHKIHLIFNSPKAMEKLLDALNTMMIGGLYPEAVTRENVTTNE